MKNKSLSLAIVAAVLILLLFGAWTARMSSGEAPSSPPPVLPAPHTKVPEKPSEASPVAPGVSEAPDPAKFLVGELLVQVLSTEGKPIAGAELSPSLSKNAFEGEEGVLPD